MKKLAKKKLVLSPETIQLLARELTQVVGGRPPCTENESGCIRIPSGATCVAC